jgi:uncharacterized membrane protein YqjE
MKSEAMQTLRSLAQGLAGMAENRLRLLQSELADEAGRLGTLLAFQVLIALLALLTVQFLALVILALVWDTPWRVTAMVSLVAIAGGGTALAYRSYTSRKKRVVPMFATSLDELRKDREALEKA